MNHPANHNQQPHNFQPQQAFPPQPVAPAKKEPKRVRRSLAIVGAVGALFLGYNVGNVGDGETATADPAPTATTTVTTTAEPKTEEKPKAKPAEKKEEPKPETFGDGTYLVGDEMPAGRYKVTVPDDSWGCYWERNSDDSGEFDAIIANEAGESGAKMSVTVNEGEFFNTSDCGEWVAA